MAYISSKEYPQFVEAGVKKTAEDTIGGRKIETPSNLKEGDGTKLVYPSKVLEYQITEYGLRIRCSTVGKQNSLVYTHETSMFQMLDCKALTDIFFVNIEIWQDNIFRVWYSMDGSYHDHLEGLPEEYHMLIGKPGQVKWDVTDCQQVLYISTESIDILIEKEVFRITAKQKDGKLFYRQRRNDIFTSDIFDLGIGYKDERYAAFEALELEYDEEIYGLGERFDAVARKGRSTDFYNKDAIGTTSTRTYVNIPFYFSTKKYGVFLNSTARTEWEIGTKDASALGISVMDQQMDYFVIHGHSPKEILKGYLSLTGFAPMPPVWSFGLWMSRNSYTSWEKVEKIAGQLREHDIPCDVIHLDTAWFQEDWNCDLKFSKERFPNPKEHMEKLKKQGFRISLWQYNYIPPRDNNCNYLEALEKGYFCKNEQGKPYQLPAECVGSWVDDRILDFSDKSVRTWYGSMIKKLIELGASAIKTDFGEGIPEEAQYKNIEGPFFHNLYSLVYNKTVADAVSEVSGEHIVWARSGTAGSQRYPLHWGGDSQCSFPALAGTLRAAISIGYSGIPFFSHDIGGFIGVPTPELYIRWAQFGLFSSHARCHGAGDNTFREPWRFGEQVEEIFRKYDKLRYSLMPYIISQAETASKEGLPMVRGLYLEFSQDRNTRYIEDEYMFGESFLVAPILKPLAESEIRVLYLPKGEWIDFWTKEEIDSQGQWIERRVDLETMPLYVKKGSIIPFGEASVSLGLEKYETTWTVEY